MFFFAAAAVLPRVVRGDSAVHHGPRVRLLRGARVHEGHDDRRLYLCLYSIFSENK